jgi:hypothetical protein
LLSLLLRLILSSLLRVRLQMTLLHLPLLIQQIAMEHTLHIGHRGVVGGIIIISIIRDEVVPRIGHHGGGETTNSVIDPPSAVIIAVVVVVVVCETIVGR